MGTKITKIHPSELSEWVYCKKKWLFAYEKRKKKLSEQEYPKKESRIKATSL